MHSKPIGTDTFNTENIRAFQVLAYDFINPGG